MIPREKPVQSNQIELEKYRSYQTKIALLEECLVDVHKITATLLLMLLLV